MTLYNYSKEDKHSSSDEGSRDEGPLLKPLSLHIAGEAYQLTRNLKSLTKGLFDWQLIFNLETSSCCAFIDRLGEGVVTFRRKIYQPRNLPYSTHSQAISTFSY